MTIMAFVDWIRVETVLLSFVGHLVPTFALAVLTGFVVWFAAATVANLVLRAAIEATSQRSGP